MAKLETVLCAITTPFHENEEVNYEGLKQNLNWFVEQGIGGVVICGGTGEFVSLDLEERMKIAEVAVKEINNRMVAVVGCAAESTRNVIKLAKHAKSIGADGIMVINSFYHKPSDEEILNHFKVISESVDIPVILYNNPGASGTDISLELATEILKLKNIDYIKEATGDVTRIRSIKQLIGTGKYTMCGSDEIICETIDNLATGWVSITANICPSGSQKVFDLAINNEKDEARKLFYNYQKLYTVCETHSKGIQIAKYGLDKLGQVGGECRLPRLPLTNEEKAEVDQMLIDAGLI